MDIKTIFLCLILTNVSMSFILLAYWKTQKTYSGFALWTIGASVISSAYASFALRGSIPDFISIFIASGLMLFSAAARTDALGKFTGESKLKILYILAGAGTAGHFFFTYFHPDIIIRLALFSTFIVIILSFQMKMILKHYKSNRTLSVIFLTLNIVFIMATIVRAVQVTISGQPQNVFAGSIVNIIFFFSLIVYDSMGSVVFILMNSSRLTEELTAAHKLLEMLASTDYLTGLYNRRKFFEKALDEMERFIRSKTFLSAAYIDIDNFKSLNDKFGHAAGDEVLRKVTDVIKKGIRGIDSAGRIGGEEFCILFPATTKKDSVMVMERLRREVSDIEFYFAGKKTGITISAGVTEAGEHDKTADNLIMRADKLLLKAKQLGKNQVISD
ncbi:MAG: diguanylate cyclase [Spirochaetes bacterium]|nr:diguanylate cyclase [Spirochaetota bacterium]